MQRIIARPNQLDLDSPGRRDYWVALEHDSNWADWLIPLTVFVGPKTVDGQGLVASGSNHGNEYEGPVALKHLMHEIDIDDVIGRIIFIPVLNPAAFHAGRRESTLADGVNLNRAFVDGAGEHPALSGITHRIAKFYRDYIWPRVHIVIDLHSGGEATQLIQCASFHAWDDPARQKVVHDTARWFGTPFILTYQNDTPGLLPSEAERLGKITIGTELGYGESVTPIGVRYGRQGVLAAAINHGLLRGSIAKIGAHADGTQKRVTMIDRQCFMPAPFRGHFEPLYDVGVMVSKGQLLGYLHDFYHIDQLALELRAPLDGCLIAQGLKAPTPQGHQVIIVGQVVED